MLSERMKDNSSDYEVAKIELSEEYRKYAEKSYPSNHTYKILENTIRPKCKLTLRYQKIKKLFPEKLTSLVDIGCSKGFFIFAASTQLGSTRNLGIDIDDYDIQFCRAVKNHFRNPNVNFEIVQLHELAERIDEFGGPFQTVLLVNTYQYLYFGSARSSLHYQSHDEIFKSLRKICSERLIFNNRMNLTECQNIEHINDTNETESDNYNEQKIIESASKYFSIAKRGNIGRYPLWAMDVKR